MNRRCRNVGLILVSLWLVPSIGALVAAPPTFVESRLVFPGGVISYETPDIDDDKLGDLAALVRERGKRVMMIYLLNDRDGYPPEPNWRFTLPDEVVAYAFRDVRDDPGLEMLLFSRRGMYSISPATAKVRGNLRVEFKGDLFPELADRDGLPKWDWFIDVDSDGTEEVLVPTAKGLLVCAKTKEGGFASIATIDGTEEVDDRSDRLRVELGDAKIGFRSSPLPALMFPGASSTYPVLDDDLMLHLDRELKVPRLMHWDADGRLDIVRVGGGRVGFRWGKGLAQFEDEVEWIGDPEADFDVDIELRDLDGDGRAEVIKTRDEGDGITKEHHLAIFGRVAAREIDSEAKAALRFNASSVDYEFRDVNSDGRVDIIATRLELPSTLGALTNLTVESSLLIFLGGESLTYRQKPDVRFDRKFKPDELSRVGELLVMNLEGDYNGDGLFDLVTIRPDGLVEIRPLERQGSEGALGFRSEPSSTYLPTSPVVSARPAWLTRDGVSDLVLRHAEGITLFVSKSGGAR